MPRTKSTLDIHDVIRGVHELTARHAAGPNNDIPNPGKPAVLPSFANYPLVDPGRKRIGIDGRPITLN